METHWHGFRAISREWVKCSWTCKKISTKKNFTKSMSNCSRAPLLLHAREGETNHVRPAHFQHRAAHDDHQHHLLGFLGQHLQRREKLSLRAFLLGLCGGYF